MLLIERTIKNKNSRSDNGMEIYAQLSERACHNLTCSVVVIYYQSSRLLTQPLTKTLKIFFLFSFSLSY